MTTDDRADLRAGIEETLTWLTFYSGYTAGYKAGGGDTSSMDVMREVTRDAHSAYRQHVAEQSERQADV